EGIYYTDQPIISGGNFTWGEATHGGTRIPHKASVVHNFTKMAAVMQEIREMFGNKPIRVNSWYRDPVTNRRVGGASRSRHLEGDAIDFVIPGIHPQDVYRRLDPWWGARGGLASTRSDAFTHIDGRGTHDGFPPGKLKARWQYGF
ncbi:MAG: D-Ala-D-Ala carboxypeptidase family metallohydrolase, partial [Cyanobacteria bacterium P01_D01_bin.36]